MKKNLFVFLITGFITLHSWDRETFNEMEENYNYFQKSIEQDDLKVFKKLLKDYEDSNIDGHLFIRILEQNPRKIISYIINNKLVDVELNPVLSWIAVHRPDLFPILIKKFNPTQATLNLALNYGLYSILAGRTVSDDIIEHARKLLLNAGALPEKSL